MISSIDVSLIIGYIVLCIAIGWWASRKQTSQDYLIHGRKLGLFAFVATSSASFVGGGAIVAYTAYVYEFGLPAIAVYIAGFISYVIFSLYAKRLRTEGAKFNYHTMADFFYQHFGKKAGLATALIMLITMFMYIVNQFIAGSSVLAEVSGWSYEVALLVSGSVVLVYLLLGGLRSVVKTDIFQYLVMIVLLLAIGIGMATRTGIDPSLLQVSSMPITLMLSFFIYGLIVPFSIGDVWQKIYAAKSVKVAQRGMILSGFFILLMSVGISLIGLSAKTGFPGIDPARATAYGLVNILPAGLLGLGLLVLFAAIMSSTDTTIFYVSTSIAKDYCGHWFGTLSDEELHRITRISLIVITLLGVLFAFFFRDLIAVVLTLAGLSAAMVPPIIASFHWKVKSNAIILALVCSTIYMVVLLATGNVQPDLAIVSLFVSLAALVVGQFVFKALPKPA